MRQSKSILILKICVFSKYDETKDFVNYILSIFNKLPMPRYEYIDKKTRIKIVEDKGVVVKKKFSSLCI